MRDFYDISSDLCSGIEDIRFCFAFDIAAEKEVYVSERISDHNGIIVEIVIVTYRRCYGDSSYISGIYGVSRSRVSYRYILLFHDLLKLGVRSGDRYHFFRYLGYEELFCSETPYDPEHSSHMIGVRMCDDHGIEFIYSDPAEVSGDIRISVVFSAVDQYIAFSGADQCTVTLSYVDEMYGNAVVAFIYRRIETRPNIEFFP